ncbi:hypothetical protein GPECTOR_8g263 [Gonium pectorale]|uniref:ABM domain-containing protein n=1 Tax=Gonium pectorale TaxID=33097 RepID=A0A150GSU2_GONPE|nr:hypothetical protein GPECTOR_8g263 [Gonium pectorale]|eukprot:KXZ52883.1 hypothetical protein GPECTOR_8g263 [Gonium pectorale]
MFDCVRDGWETNTFHFWERYETTEAFGDHTAAPRMVQLMTKLQPHLERPVGISLYSYEEGRLGPSAIQAGKYRCPKGEGGLDDATGASGAAGGASYKQTSRAFDLTKINEHEETQREQQLLASMSVDGSPEAQPGPAAAADGAQQAADGAGGSRPEGTKGKARNPLPSVGDLVSLAVDVKDSVMSAVCRMLKH